MLATLKAPKFFRDVANSCPLPMDGAGISDKRSVPPYENKDPAASELIRLGLLSLAFGT